MKNITSTCPPYALFLLTFGTVVAFGLFKLWAALHSAGLGQ